MDLAKERFYGAKTEPIDEITVAASQPAGIYTWQLLDVAHGGTTDTYQVLADEHSDRDQLNTEAGAQPGGSTAPILGRCMGISSARAQCPWVWSNPTPTSSSISSGWSRSSANSKTA
ncbi:hypothetical protein [Corynebacterium pilosum]|uniref:hypothetical protein n=1 Tax=Corynebacterium pilosum TaxID=35756 RepID=UPI000AD868B7|nr:hypothetical protein [Corynebacterium pilosum]